MHFKTHGESSTPLYNIWQSMRDRCRCKTHNAYKYYGGKGIKVCEAWDKDYTVFRDWSKAAGYKVGLSLDRLDTSLGYCPGNCQWLTRSENSKKMWSDMAKSIAEKDRIIAALRKELHDRWMECAVNGPSRY